jgi:hypothetical protein
MSLRNFSHGLEKFFTNLPGREIREIRGKGIKGIKLEGLGLSNNS